MNVFHKTIIAAGRRLFGAIGGRRTHRIGHLVARWMPKTPQEVDMGGYVLWLDLRHASDLIRAWGVWEEGLTRFLQRNLKPGMTFVDIGAHHGTYTIMAAAIVGPSGHVHAFEPFPESAVFLKQSVALNQFGHVTVHEMAASDQDGECTISVAGPHIVEGGELRVPMRRIDDEVAGNVSFVKIDTDGSEERVLAGMKQKLLDGTNVIVEVSDFEYQTFAESLRLVAEPLAQLGYLPELICSDGSTIPFIEGANEDRQIHLLFRRSS